MKGVSIGGSGLLFAFICVTISCASAAPPTMLIHKSKEHLWKDNERDRLFSSCFVDENTVLLGAMDGSIWKLDIASKEYLRSQEFDPALQTRGLVLYPDLPAKRILCIDGDGRIVSRSLPDLAVASMAQTIERYPGNGWEGGHSYVSSAARYAYRSTNSRIYDVMVWDLNKQQIVSRIQSEGGGVLSVALVPVGDDLYLVAGHNVELWTVGSSPRIKGRVDFREMKCIARDVKVVKYNDRNALCVGFQSFDENVLGVAVLSIPELKILQELRFAGDTALSMTVSDQGDELIIGTSAIPSKDVPSLAFVSLKRNTVRHLQFDREGWFHCGASFSPSGARCLELSLQGLRVWQLHTIEAK